MGHYVSLINGMSNAQADDFMSFATDLLDGNSGIVASGDYAVAQSSPVAMSVTVATGKAYIYISSLLSYYRTILDAAATLSIASNSSGSTRIDLICIKIDTGASPDADASNVASVVVVQGTPGGGAPATPANHYKLAEVTVASGAASIANANITDSRVQLNIRVGTKVGGVTPGSVVVASQAEVAVGSDNSKAVTPLAISKFTLPPRGFIYNGKILPSVTSNNLTVAIKGMDGNDPSASNPVYVRIGDTVRTITSALSVTKNAGTNWFNAGSAELATYETDYFVYLGYNATDGVVIGFARIPYASEYDDFSTTTTNEKYCAISTITNAAAGDDYEVVGRFAATLSAGAGYTWSVPTFTNKNLLQRPIYETRRLFYKVNPTGYSTPATIAGFYKVTMTDCLVNWSFSGGTVGTSNSTGLTYPLPFTSANRSGMYVTSIGRNYNNGAEGTGGQCNIPNNVASATLFNGIAGATWTAANGKFWEGQTIYQIA